MKNNVKLFRIVRDMTQYDLSLATGISRPNISNIENGSQTPSAASMVKIASALKASEEAIFFKPVVLQGLQQGDFVVRNETLQGTHHGTQ